MNSKKECSHRCGAYHRAFVAKVRIARSEKRKDSDSNVCELEIFCTLVRSHGWIYIGAPFFLLAVGAVLMVILFPNM